MLIKCQDCGHAMSSNAKACPSCGWRGRRPASGMEWIVAIVLFGLALVIVVGVLWFLWGGLKYY